jgi:serine/threonine protein kinase
MAQTIGVERTTSGVNVRHPAGHPSLKLRLPRILTASRALAAAALTARTTIYLVCQAQETMSAEVWFSALALEFALLCAVLVKIAMSWPRADRAPRSEMEDLRLGSYTLGEKIGEGGMGVVYKAQHAMLKRPTAVKLLPAERAAGRDLERFEREVQLTSTLTHPNTISVYDFGRTSEGSFYYAMEYLDGLDLQALVEKTGPQPPARVAHLLSQLCGALAEAHDVGLLHRDVKPANVFLCERGGMRDVVKVLDFGLIKEFGSRSDDTPQTETNAIVGTPMYLAPEAVTAPETMDGRSDLYAVGALGYFLLTGAPPFSGKTLIDVCCQHLHAAPMPPSARVASSIPAELEELIMSCLAKSPARRPADAATLQRALRPLAAAWTQDVAARWWANRSAATSAPRRLESKAVSQSDVSAMVDQAA